MKKTLIGFSLFAMIILLAGCISIPIGDNVLKISTDGIEFVDGEGNMDEAAGDEEEDAEEEESDEAESDETDEAESDETDEADETKDADSSAKSSKSGCQEEDHSSVTDVLVPGFYIPECAVLESVSKDSTSLTAGFSVPGADWKDIFNEYKEYFGDNLDSESENPQSGSGEMYAYIYPGDDSNYVRIRIDQNEDYVALQILQYFPEK